MVPKWYFDQRTAQSAPRLNRTENSTRLCLTCCYWYLASSLLYYNRSRQAPPHLRGEQNETQTCSELYTTIPRSTCGGCTTAEIRDLPQTVRCDNSSVVCGSIKRHFVCCCDVVRICLVSVQLSVGKERESVMQVLHSSSVDNDLQVARWVNDGELMITVITH